MLDNFGSAEAAVNENNYLKEKLHSYDIGRKRSQRLQYNGLPYMARNLAVLEVTPPGSGTLPATDPAPERAPMIFIFVWRNPFHFGTTKEHATVTKNMHPEFLSNLEAKAHEIT